MKNELKNLIQGKTSIKDVLYYMQGMYRYRLWYSNFGKKFIRKHIEKQIDYRVLVMNPLCYSQGSCIKCGCMTIALQMCNKPCEGNCYPPMLSAGEWFLYYRGSYPVFRRIDKAQYWIIVNGETKFIGMKVKNV